MALAIKRIPRIIQNVTVQVAEKCDIMPNATPSKATTLVRKGTSAGSRRRNQIQSRIYPITLALSHREPHRAAAVGHQMLDQQRRVPDKLRPRFCILAVGKFLNAGDWDRALGFYLRMKSESMPGQAEALSMLLAGSLKLPSTTTKLDYLVREAPKTFDRIEDPQIQAILSHLVRQKKKIYTIREFLVNIQQRMGEEWIPSWEVCALMAQAEAQEGYDLAARDWFLKAKRRIGELEQNRVDSAVLHEARQNLYTKLIIGSAAFNENRPIFFNKILHQMKQDQVNPNRRIFNFFIQRHSRTGRADRAFAFYRSMRSSNPAIPADHHTFHSLFSASTSKTHSYWPLEWGGRRLFHDMTRQHLSNTDHRPQTKSNVITTAVLNAALRYFMHKRDYAAATVTMRTFPVCCIPPNINTHNTVVDGLLARIQEEVSKNTSEKLVQWSDRILGEVVRLLNGAWIDIAAKLYATVERGARRARSNGIDVLFLLGLLRRAMLATLNRWPDKEPEVDKYVLKRVMNGAKAAMLPPKAANATGWFMAAS